MAKAKKSAKEGSELFHNIMKASVKGNPAVTKNKENMSTITIPINGNPVDFNYSITKTSDSKKKDRFWAVKVSHQNNSITHIPQQFGFTYDTLENIIQSKIDGKHEEIALKIIEKEGA